MDQPNRQSSQASGAILFLIIASTSIALLSTQIVSSRPSPRGDYLNQRAQQMFPARQWEDPYGSTERYVSKNPEVVRAYEEFYFYPALLKCVLEEVKRRQEEAKAQIPPSDDEARKANPDIAADGTGEALQAKIDSPPTVNSTSAIPAILDLMRSGRVYGPEGSASEPNSIATLNQSSKGIPGMAFRSPRWFLGQDEAFDALHVIPVLIPGTGYPEDVEDRIRSRVAVQAALSRADFVHTHPDQLGLFTYVPDSVWIPARDFHCDRIISDSEAHATGGDETRKTTLNIEVFEAIADRELKLLLRKIRPHMTRVSFEVYRRGQDEKGRAKIEYALVLWIDENYLARPILTSDDLITHALYGQNDHDGLSSSSCADPEHSAPRFLRRPLTLLLEIALTMSSSFGSSSEEPERGLRVIGPYSSGTVRAMLEELNLDQVYCLKRIRDAAGHQFERGIDFFSPWSTVDAAALVKGLAPVASSNGAEAYLQAEFWTRAGITFSRGGSDRLLAEALVEELVKRRVHILHKKQDTWTAGDVKIVLLGEQDTLYGSTIESTFRDVIREKGGDPDDVIFRSYLRGIDGWTQDYRAESNQPADHRLTNQDGSSGELGSPHGENQADYLKRLASELKLLRRQLEEAETKPFRAIGLVGSDQFDKLLILRALRSEFSDCVFFTTDLDAVLTEAAEYPHARNLVVASNFGLELDDKLQAEVPSFRSSYQTAVFFAAFRAVVPQVDESYSLDSEQRRIFEIGRTGAIDLTPKREGGFATVHPVNDLRPPYIFSKGVYTWTFVSAALIIALLLLLSEAIRSAFRRGPGSFRPSTPLYKFYLADPRFGFTLWEVDRAVGLSPDERAEAKRTLTLNFVTIAVVVCAVFLVAWIARFGLDRGDAEPFSLFDGVSVWPTVMIRAACVIIAMYLILKIQRFDLKEQRRRIITNYGQALTFDDEKSANQKNPDEPATPLKPIVLWYHRRSLIWLRWRSPKIRDNASKINARIAPRLWWPLLLTAILLMIYVTLPGREHYFSSRRGVYSWLFDGAAQWAVTLAQLLLVAWVLDATMACRSFIVRLGNTIHDRSRRLSDDRHCKRDIRRGRLIARLTASETAVVGRFIYYSFGVMFLVLAARSDTFDYYNWPVSVIVLVLVVVVCHVVALAMLQLSARRIRDLVRRNLYSNLSLATMTPSLARETREVIDEIDNLNEGAFQPLFQNTLFRALLVPIGGIGSIAGLERLVSMMVR